MKTIFLALIVFSSTAFTFTLNTSTNPNLKGWSGADVKIYLNPNNCPAGVDVAGIIEDAVAVWNNIPSSSIKVSYGGTTSSTTMSNPTTAYCETNFQTVVGADQNFVPGAAAVNGNTGTISGGILYLNASAGTANISNMNRETLKIILAHEIGHILGLGHSHNEAALMYYDASYKQQFRLAQDDIDGMTYLYPKSDLGLNNLAGCALVKNNINKPNATHKFAWTLLLLFPFLLALALRRSFKDYAV